MKKIAFPFLTILLLSTAAVAQTDLPPARSATIFKNGRSVVQRFGAVPVTDQAIFDDQVAQRPVWYLLGKRAQ